MRRVSGLHLFECWNRLKMFTQESTVADFPLRTSLLHSGIKWIKIDSLSWHKMRHTRAQAPWGERNHRCKNSRRQNNNNNSKSENERNINIIYKINAFSLSIEIDPKICSFDHAISVDNITKTIIDFRIVVTACWWRILYAYVRFTQTHTYMLYLLVLRYSFHRIIMRARASQQKRQIKWRDNDCKKVTSPNKREKKKEEKRLSRKLNQMRIGNVVRRTVCVCVSDDDYDGLNIT